MSSNRMAVGRDGGPWVPMALHPRLALFVILFQRITLYYSKEITC